MLLRIERHQARLGMFVESLEGSWLDHPFWTQRFVINDHDSLLKLQNSSVSTLVIDLDKGLGPKVQKLPPSPPLSAIRSTAASPRLGRAPVDPQIARARETLRRTTRALRELFDDARGGQPIHPGRAAAIVDEVASAMRHRPHALLGITRLKTKDEYSYLHSVAVCALMTHFGRFLRLDPEFVQTLGLAGLFHDIGKATLPSELLGKRDTLSEEEMALMRTHPLEGFRMLENQDLPDMVREVCLHHHERIDGAGYPKGLADDEISLGVRIAAICDVYDAVTSVRPYKEAWSAKTAFRRMWEWEGHFDRVLLDQFFRSIGVKGQKPSNANRSPAQARP
ncbi:HD-GYP domain-containing protein [Aureimonas sp. ME7]|uniref:HD-GYP domain-containing protein n=1 Tax=Aureimonas sp. ME7 TaxID=2744252 RepID=UPI0015F6E129|nr:HD-GYP domain-containing protein [Aureimonas sp. ME7]